MIAIETKYLPATETRGSRIKATAVGFQVNRTVTVPYDSGIGTIENHHSAVFALVEKHGLKWDVKTMVFGGTGRGFVFCFPQSVITRD